MNVHPAHLSATAHWGGQLYREGIAIDRSFVTPAAA